jgi:hypothetical protein
MRNTAASRALSQASSTELVARSGAIASDIGGAGRSGRARHCATQSTRRPPSAFFIIGLLIWAVRSWKREQVEQAEYQIHEVHRTGVL